MPSSIHLGVIICQALLILLVSPLLNGIIKKVKARLQSRIGPSIFQPYYDIIKYFKKDAVISDQASWLTITTPYLVFAAILTAGLLLPVWTVSGFVGDIILFIFLLGFSRFFISLTALDAGSAFGGMGASREMALNTLIEPAFFLAIFAMIIQTGSTEFSRAISEIHSQGWSVYTLSYVLAFAAMILVIIAETGRIPVDNPDTHLELTMIHEGMILEYSGRYLGLMVWSTMMKQFILLSLFANLFLPFGIGEFSGFQGIFVTLVILILKVFGLGVLLAVIETTYAKMRLFQVPKLFITSMMLSLLAIVVSIVF